MPGAVPPDYESWDAPLVRLPSRDAVGDYLVGKGVDPERARAAAATVDVTKRGAVILARR